MEKYIPENNPEGHFLPL